MSAPVPQLFLTSFIQAGTTCIGANSLIQWMQKFLKIRFEKPDGIYICRRQDSNPVLTDAYQLCTLRQHYHHSYNYPPNEDPWRTLVEGGEQHNQLSQ